MSRNAYAVFHKKNKKDGDTVSLDAITLEETDPGNKYQTISYTRFIFEVVDREQIRISPVKSVYWNLDGAKQWFLEHHNIRDPETNSSILFDMVFKTRLFRQVELSQYYENGYEPEDALLKELFLTYINHGVLSGKELSLLHNFFHIDNTILMKWKEECEEPSKHREFSNQLIEKADKGSWLIRQTSVKESDVIKTRVITFKTKDGIVRHCVFAHVYGCGYILPQGMQSGMEMPSLGSGEYITIKNHVFASFIDLITHLVKFTDCDFKLDKLIY